jgi:hypothetical protein
MAAEDHGGDALAGRRVAIRSLGGIEYLGTVLSIRRENGGELFELGEGESKGYRRFVFVKDRAAQIRTPE